MKKRIAILGSTGSIGLNALNVFDEHPEELTLVAFACDSNTELLEQQIFKYKPEFVAVTDEIKGRELKKKISGRTEVLFGQDSVISMISNIDVQLIVSAISGSAGLLPTYEAVRCGIPVALANKEALVCAGSLLIKEAEKNNIEILPIDSEHSAIFQCLQGHTREDLKRIILTASGGPFQKYTKKEMADVTPNQALAHPNWNMGKKVTIDSATLMNKGLEVIEAKWLFNLKPDEIAVVIHPQSIIHSMVEYMDGSIIAQMGIPNMRVPISYSIFYPRHLINSLPHLSLTEIKTLSFYDPDIDRFPCLGLAFDAINEGGKAPVVLNGANEIAVSYFLKNAIPFMSIPSIIKETLNGLKQGALNSIEEVVETNLWARKKAENIISKYFI